MRVCVCVCVSVCLCLCLLFSLSIWHRVWGLLSLRLFWFSTPRFLISWPLLFCSACRLLHWDILHATSNPENLEDLKVSRLDVKILKPNPPKSLLLADIQVLSNEGRQLEHPGTLTLAKQALKYTTLKGHPRKAS